LFANQARNTAHSSEHHHTHIIQSGGVAYKLYKSVVCLYSP